MIRHVLRSGLSLVRSLRRVVAVFYLANLAFAALIIFPAFLLLDRFADQSLLGISLADRMDIGFLIEFVRYNRDGVTALAALALFVLPLSWTAGLFLSGGAFASFGLAGPDTSYRPVLFWGGAARYFGRFLRLALLIVPVCAVILSLPLLEKVIERLLFGDDPYQYVGYWGGWVRNGLRFAGIILCAMLFDYARIHTVLADERKMRTAVVESARFIFSHPGSTVGLVLSILVVGFLLLGGYAGLAPVVSGPETAAVILLILLQQAVVLALTGLRLTLYASQLQLYREESRGDGS